MRIFARGLLSVFAALAPCVFAVGAGAQSARPEHRAGPDILLLMPDQFRGDCLSTLGHPAVRTPTLDALAEQGTLFRRAYCTVPSCVPARHSLLTGQYPQTSGVVGYKGRRISVPTLPRLLRENGYRTALVGRNMHQFPSSDDLGYTTRLLGSTYLDGDDYDKALREAAPATGGIVKLVADLGLTFNHWQAAPWPLDESLHPSTWVVDRAIETVRATPAEQPLFLTASFYAPHPPLFPPAAQFEDYLRAELPAPARGDWVAWQALSADGDRQGHRIRLEGPTLQHAQAGYFGLIEHLDQRLAGLIAAFRERAEAADRPWLVLCTSDHGELLGDHGYFRKCQPYEGSSNIPMVIAGSPELGFAVGARNHRPVCLEDILPTICDLCGIDTPADVDGRSLVPALRGEAVEIRPWLHFEHAPCYDSDQAFHALTDGRHKFVWRPTDGSEQLFDLQQDPREEHDLARDKDAADLCEVWRRRLIERLASRPEGFSDGARLIPGREYLPLMRR
ncbi:MAG: sulfatase-like hydrolase/transferase [Planctomycetota bacterium]